MSETPDSSVIDGARGLASVLADPRKRRLLSILYEESSPMTVRDLAVRLAAREENATASEVTEDDVHRQLVDLIHRHLPKLDRGGWIERHPEGVVALGEPLFRGAKLPRYPVAGSDIQWEALAALLERPRRQRVVSVIADRDRPLSLDELAEEMADRGSITQSEGEASLDPAATLHHIDLPKLAEEEIIEYDSGEKTITADVSLFPVTGWIGDADSE